MLVGSTSMGDLKMKPLSAKEANELYDSFKDNYEQKLRRESKLIVWYAKRRIITKVCRACQKCERIITIGIPRNLYAKNDIVDYLMSLGYNCKVYTTDYNYNIDIAW